MKVISGHLTATEKRAIQAILAQNLTSGRVGKKEYFLQLNEAVYTVKIKQKDRGLGFIGESLRTSTHTKQFTL